MSSADAAREPPSGTAAGCPPLPCVEGGMPPLHKRGRRRTEHSKKATFMSGMTGVTRVTMPLIITSLSMSIGSRSRSRFSSFRPNARVMNFCVISLSGYSRWKSSWLGLGLGLGLGGWG